MNVNSKKNLTNYLSIEGVTYLLVSIEIRFNF